MIKPPPKPSPPAISDARSNRSVALALAVFGMLLFLPIPLGFLYYAWETRGPSGPDDGWIGMGLAILIYGYGPIALFGLALSAIGWILHGKAADREAKVSGRVLKYPLPDDPDLMRPPKP